MDWIIVRTKYGKENYVANAISRMGFPAWVPVEIRSHRTNLNRKSNHRTLIEVPLLPKTLFAGLPEALHSDLQAVRYYDRLERDEALEALKIEDWEMTAFRAEVEYHNERERERQKREAAPPKKQEWMAAPEALLKLRKRMDSQGVD